MSSHHPSPPAPDPSADPANPPIRGAQPGAGEGRHADGAMEGPSSATTMERCLNCDAELAGRYCAQCGQDAHRGVFSLRHMLEELIEDISQADARVWRTLRLLALRPGELTCEYLRGKRASFTPPLKLYVALSLPLFLVSLLPEVRDPNIKVVVGGTEAVTLTPKAVAALDGALIGVDRGYREALRKEVIAAMVNVPAAQQVGAVTELAETCGVSPLGVAVLSKGIKSQLPHEKMVANCKKVAGTAQKMLDDATEYAPKMMVFFLPLIALFGKLLYFGSRRYYIGHLVFFVHFHAFVFLVMTVGNLGSSLAALSTVKWLKDVSDLIVLGLIVCVPIYLYKAMRRVYGQGLWATCLKFVLLCVGYLINFIFSAALLAVFVALQSHVDWREALNAIDFGS